MTSRRSDTLRAFALLFAAQVSLGSAQVFVPAPKNMNLVESKNYPGASISYKENSLCETVEGVRSYSGYLNLPPAIDRPYNSSVFFWYFDSRNDPSSDPITIYLPGGPGESFLDGAGALPCVLNPDSNSTSFNPWSWNNVTNMLYVDLPLGAGYSYGGTPVNGTVDLLTGTFTPLEEPLDTPATNFTTVQTTVAYPDPSLTANTTAQVARMAWQFSQVWFQEFPEYNSNNDQINVWTYSYSGFFGPAIFKYFTEQNEEIKNGTIKDSKAKELSLGTLGINNGCMDSLVQGATFPEMAYNNTYGIQVYSEEIYQQAKEEFSKPGSGCIDTINACRAAAAVGDPEGYGSNTTVNDLCVAATAQCFGVVQGAYTASSNRSAFDMAAFLPAVFPQDMATGFYNQRWVQEELGAAVNFSLVAKYSPYNFFQATGDPMIRTIGDIDYLLSAGLNLALVYGDRDYRCNWLGVENISLTMEYPEAPAFRSAGYENITTNPTYSGGMVRQHGNVSFSRVYQAGHAVAAYQPETVYQIYSRAILGKDIATGTVEVGATGNYSSTGPESAFWRKNEVPPQSEVPQPQCYFLDMPELCSADEIAAVANGTAEVKDYIVTISEGATQPSGTSGAGRTSIALYAVLLAVIGHLL